MRKVGLVALVVLLLVPLLSAPAEADRWRHGGHGRHGRGGFFIGVGVGALLAAPWWYYRPAYAYPVYYPYPYPSYYSYPGYADPVYAPTYETTPAYAPPPATMTPTPQPLSPPPQGGTEGAPPSQPGTEAAPGAAAPPAPQALQRCQTVWVEGHYETRVMANGQRVTVWVPAHTQQICQ